MRIGFFIREALRALKRNAVPSFAAMATVLVTVLILGVFIPVVQATTGAANEVRGRVIANVYLVDHADDADVARVRNLLENDTPHVARVEFVSKDQAYARAAQARTPRPTASWASSTRCRTCSGSRPTTRTTSPRSATRCRRSAPAAPAR